MFNKQHCPKFLEIALKITGGPGCDAKWKKGFSWNCSTTNFKYLENSNNPSLEKNKVIASDHI